MAQRLSRLSMPVAHGSRWSRGLPDSHAKGLPLARQPALSRLHARSQVLQMLLTARLICGSLGLCLQANVPSQAAAMSVLLPSSTVRRMHLHARAVTRMMPVLGARSPT